MPEYMVVQQAIYSPTNCFFCMEFNGPFVDTGMEDPRYGHIYICGPTADRVGCIGQWTHLFAGKLAAEVADLQSEKEQLAKELEQARNVEQTVQLTYEDLVKAMEESKELLTGGGS